MRTPRVLAALAAAGVLATGLAACGGDDAADHHGTAGPSVAASEDFNSADVVFATAMIQHHAQALVMVDLVDDREVSSELAALAEQIRMAQVPEIELMVGWLTDWDQPVPETVRDHVNGGHGDEHGTMGHDAGHDAGMPGMMSAADMSELADADDDQFEDLWLTMMVEHHEGAVTMAQDEVDDGEDPAAIDLAEAIIESQGAEIDQMEQMLG